MKQLASVALILCFLSGSLCAEAFKSPDILLDSKLSSNWSGLLVSKVRRLLRNYDITDPFKYQFNERIIISEALVEEYLSLESKALLTDLGNVIGLNILHGKTEIAMDGFSYDVKDFSADLKASEETKEGLVISSDFSASEARLSADKMLLRLAVPSNKNDSQAFLEIEIVKPVVYGSHNGLIDFFAKFIIQDNKDFYKVVIQDSDFKAMAAKLASVPDKIELSYERIIVPAVKFKVGSKVVEFSPTKVEAILRKNHNALKGLLIAQLASMLKEGTGQKILQLLEVFKINKEYWLDASIIQSQIQISQFASTLDRNNLEVNMPGDFCTKEKFSLLKRDCIKNKITQASKSRLNNKMHGESLVNMKSLIDQGEANLVASISEDYMNKLLVATYDAGLWKDVLDEAGVGLGPQKAFIRLDEHGDSGSLFMDIVYTPKKLEKMALGVWEVRFPLVMKVALRIEKHAEVPVVIIRLNDLDLTDDTLINGRPEVGMVSTIKNIKRFEKKIVHMIRGQLEGMKGKDIIDLRYPELMGLGLQNVNFLSDGKGRMNAIMKFEDLIEEEHP